MTRRATPSNCSTRRPFEWGFVSGGPGLVTLLLAIGLWLTSITASRQLNADEPPQPEFSIRLADELPRPPGPFRVYLFVATDDVPEPRLNSNRWLTPGIILARDVETWPPDGEVTLRWSDPGLLKFPQSVEPSQWAGRRAQAVARLNPHEHDVGSGAGNACSEVLTLPQAEHQLSGVQTVIQRVLPERPLKLPAGFIELSIRSERLSQFHGRDIHCQVLAELPVGVTFDSMQRYPVLLVIPGFGGTHRYGLRRTMSPPEPTAELPTWITITLSPMCGWGHHVFADSATNGPWGTALVEEILPQLAQQLPIETVPSSRLLNGHSSGGWSSLWLQLNYPDQFGGVWSTAPDPVDFHDFQRVNIYRPGENAFRDPAGNRRPIVRRQGQVVVWWDDFDQMEQVLGPGGQLRSFEAVFSPLSAEGTPARLWDRKTGVIDPAVANEWRAYDLGEIVRARWPQLGPKLAGKLHVFMGEEDTFYLDGAVRRFHQTLRELGSDAVIELVPDKDHFSLLTVELKSRIISEMQTTLARRH